MIRIIESKFIKSAIKPKDYPASAYAEIAFVGKSNVGKSSLINTILNRKAIAKISRTPGKTRLINFFEIRFKTNDENEGFINFVDLPGYGYAKVSKAERESWKKMIQNYFDNRLQLRGVIAIIDIRHKADPKDILMFEMLKTKQIPFAVIATKSDKIGKSKIPSTLKRFKSEFKLNNQGIIQFSSFKKIGINEVLNWISSRIL